MGLKHVKENQQKSKKPEPGFLGMSVRMHSLKVRVHTRMHA